MTNPSPQQSRARNYERSPRDEESGIRRISAVLERKVYGLEVLPDLTEEARPISSNRVTEPLELIRDLTACAVQVLPSEPPPVPAHIARISELDALLRAVTEKPLAC